MGKEFTKQNIKYVINWNSMLILFIHTTTNATEKGPAYYMQKSMVLST